MLDARRILVVLLALASTACVRSLVGSDLGQPSVLAQRSPREALVRRVSMRAPDIDSPDVLEEALTLNIAEFAKAGGYFAAVKLPPASVSDGYMLDFEFTRYEARRSVHPAYFPGAFLTMTLYIWFGGPIYRDTVSFDATLEVEDAAGNRLARVTDAVERTESGSLWSTTYGIPPSGAPERTELVRNLLDAATRQLRAGGE